MSSESNSIDNLRWLVDAPMFIDERQVDRFYDAIAKPQYIEESYSHETTRKQVAKLSGKFKIGLKLELLSSIFPFLPDLSAEVSGEKQEEQSATDRQKLQVIHNSERNLSKLTFHYLTEENERILFIDESNINLLLDADSIKKSPRLLTFLDLPAGTQMVPTAAEFENGKIELIYDNLKAKNGENPPPYPEKEESGKSLKDLRKEYWNWFSDNFNATKSMIEVEKAASSNGKIRWIAYRIKLDEEGNTLHLHVAARENYDTGTLAYNFIKRGFKHGLRLVGTLKSEPDMNVLAIYEK